MIDLISVYLPNQYLDPSLDLYQFTRRFGQRVADKNLAIYPYKDGTLLQGSIAKYWNKENASSLSRSQLRSAFCELEQRTGLDLQRGVLFSLEVGKTLLVTRPPREYLDTWQTFGRFKMMTVADRQTVKLVTQAKSFIGYDKKLEMKRRPLPAVFHGFHALRIELKYKTHKSVLKLYGRELSPWDLTTAEVQHDLEKRLKTFYFRVPKARQVRIDLKGLRQREFMMVLAHLGANQYGLDRLKHLLADGQVAGDIDQPVTSRIRKLLRDMTGDERLTDTTSLTDEVDDAVRRS